MLALLKRNLFIISIFFITLSLSFLTFLTFIGKSFIELNEQNLQNLLILDIVLLILFFILIFVDIRNSIKNNINVRGSIANRKYIISFALFTLIPSLSIAIFSLFIFSFALEKYFDKKITTAVNNSYEIAKNYVEEKRNKIESEIVLIALDLNKSSFSSSSLQWTEDWDSDEKLSEQSKTEKDGLSALVKNWLDLIGIILTALLFEFS